MATCKRCCGTSVATRSAPPAIPAAKAKPACVVAYPSRLEDLSARDTWWPRGQHCPEASASLEALILLFAAIAALGATQATHEGFLAGTHHQFLPRFGGVTGQGGERQADDEGCGPDRRDGGPDRPGDDQITDHGEDAGVLDVFLVAIIGFGGHDIAGK